MPIYQCISPEGLLDESARGKLAEEITRIHCDATGIPRRDRRGAVVRAHPGRLH